MSVQVHAPTGRPSEHRVTLAPRPASLTGMRIGLLSNGKKPAVALLEEARSRLVREHAAIVGGCVKKRKSGQPGSEGDLRRLAESSDIVLNALAD